MNKLVKYESRYKLIEQGQGNMSFIGALARNFMNLMRCLFSLIILLISSFIMVVNAEEYSSATKQLKIAYTYHSKPPDIINLENKKGSYFDLVNKLNEYESPYHFKLVYIPRNRLNRFLADEKLNGFVLGVNPKWFDDENQIRYLWTDTVFTDKDEFVSLKSTAFEYSDAESLKGKIIAASRGFIYKNIDNAVKNDNAKRLNAADEYSVLNLVLKGRADIGIVSEASLPIFIKQHDLQGKLHISSKPQDVFDRQLLVPRYQRALFWHLNSAINELNQAKR